MVLNEVKDLSQVSRSREQLVEFTGGREGGREKGRVLTLLLLLLLLVVARQKENQARSAAACLGPQNAHEGQTHIRKEEEKGCGGGREGGREGGGAHRHCRWYGARRQSEWWRREGGREGG